MVFKQRFLSELYVVFCLFHYIDVVMSVAVTQSSHGLQLFTATPASSRAPNPQNNLDLNYLSLSVFFFFFFLEMYRTSCLLVPLPGLPPTKICPGFRLFSIQCSLLHSALPQSPLLYFLPHPDHQIKILDL